MRFFIFLFVFCSLQTIVAQEDFLAKQYFNDGEFEKSVVFYEKLVKKSPRRTDYATGLIKCYQQLERYEDAENLLIEQLKDKNTYPTFIIELGYNYALQNNSSKANEYYQKAIDKINENANFGYGLGLRFQKYALLDYAAKAFIKAMELNPQLDYNFQLAKIYGEEGQIEKMYTSYLKLISEGKVSQSRVLRSIDDFVSEDAENINNLLLKKVLLTNAQKNPDPLWNELLSWLFVRQKQYGSAFRQEKAIFKRTDGATIERLNMLAITASENEDIETAKEVYQYIIDNAFDEVIKLHAQLDFIALESLDADEKSIEQIQKKYDQLITQYGYENQTLQLQVDYANFLTFTQNTPEAAIVILKKSLELPLNTRGSAFVKMALADILVYNKKFNEALIYYSQIQKRLKNDVLGQNARFKVAQTSFYKGDFDWALTQLKVLRSSTSQLIANDAMQLSLLISDNSLEDSTQTALKKYARADLLAYQNKDKESIAVLDDILENHKGEKIEDEALLKQGKLLEKQKEFQAAIFNYTKIIEFYADGILADDAYYNLGELYRSELNEPAKAMQAYEKIIYNYQDSYFFPQARRHFRELRGDSIN
ncbi:tetratricopeptide repeat protein [Aurantibacter sp.]|uniref:tetratricopeptide repeat protein n=1 Tax=Aurantibacter sp. TaxID=2807103 RepID=UPI003264B73A